MKTLAILSGKGGAGKTTPAVHLAVAAEQSGHSTAVIRNKMLLRWSQLKRDR